jgi:hypothetical protein
MSDPAYPPGWYPDPTQRFEYRFHNGTVWTADVSSNGVRYVDPLGIDPHPTDAAGDGSAVAGARRSGLAIASMTLGIIAVTISWLPFVVALGAICALLAIVFGGISLRRARDGSRRSRRARGFAIVGLTTGALALALCVVGVTLSVAVLRAVDRFENPAENEVSVTACELDGSVATMTGTITNRSTHVASFDIQVSFTRPGTDNVHRRARVAVDDVDAGAAVEFEVFRKVLLDDVDCHVTDVTGPLPFGLDIDLD